MKGPKQIYFLRPIGADGPIKIGCSINPASRLAAVTIWSPLRLEIVAVTDGGHEYERELHTRFARQRLHGEWFAPSPDLTNLINRIAAGGSLDLPTRPHRMNREASKEQIEQILSAYAQEASMREIGDSIGWSTGKVRKILIMNGVAIRKQGVPNGIRLDHITRTRGMQMRRRQGATLQKIADEYGVTRERVRQVLEKAERTFAATPNLTKAA